MTLENDAAPPVVDRSATAPPEIPADHVQLRASEVVALRQRAKLADELERDAASTIASATLAEVCGPISFSDDVAARHARALLSARITVRPDASGKLTAVDRETGRPATEALREAVNGDEFRRYRAATHRGGSATGNAGTEATMPSDPGNGIAVRLLGSSRGAPGGNSWAGFPQ